MLDFGLHEFGVKSAFQRLAHYRGYVHEKGGLATGEEGKPIIVGQKDRFRCRSRYFIDSGIIGSKEFVNRIYGQFKDLVTSRNEKHPRRISGLSGVYFLKKIFCPL